jgi:hypothetical protein
LSSNQFDMMLSPNSPIFSGVRRAFGVERQATL